jgi:hypothetical protein
MMIADGIFVKLLFLFDIFAWVLRNSDKEQIIYSEAS